MNYKPRCCRLLVARLFIHYSLKRPPVCYLVCNVLARDQDGQNSKKGFHANIQVFMSICMSMLLYFYLTPLFGVDAVSGKW